VPQRRVSSVSSVYAFARSGYAEGRAHALAAAVLLTAVSVAACGHGDAGAVPAGLGASVTGTPLAVTPVARVSLLTTPDRLAACESRIERSPGGTPPAIAVIGSSVTAGTGPGDPRLSWAVLLAGSLRRDAVIAAVPGIGYVGKGASKLGPVARLMAEEHLRALRPSLVIIQAGHDDSNVAASAELQRVEQTVALVRSSAPGARIALLTVFTTAGRPVPGVLRVIDRAIVTGSRAADPSVIIMDPLAGNWAYPRAADGLHPTVAGDAWIARRVAGILRAHGALAAARAASAGTPVICAYTVGVGSSAG
jgi:lysophospholipase L1-like esterase